MAAFRRTTLALLIAAVLAAAAAATAQPAAEHGYVVIVHPANPASSVSRQFLADAFLERRTRWADGETIRPADLQARSPVRRAFSEHVLNRSVSAVRSYWQQIIFSGRGVPPVELDDEATAVRFVLRNRGGVAYVSPSAAVGRARILSVR
jgi:ABC-type phosphate transport system substrate-binding protein